MREQLAQILRLRSDAATYGQRILQIVANLINERDAARTENQNLRIEIEILRRQIFILSTARGAREARQFNDYDRYDSGSDGAQ